MHQLKAWQMQRGVADAELRAWQTREVVTDNESVTDAEGRGRRRVEGAADAPFEGVADAELRAWQTHQLKAWQTHKLKAWQTRKAVTDDESVTDTEGSGRRRGAW